MKSKQIEELVDKTKLLLKVIDKLEQRIATLEKVLASHAKLFQRLFTIKRN